MSEPTASPIYISLSLFPPSANGIWRGGKGGRHFLSARYKAWKIEASVEVFAQTKTRISGFYALQVNLVRPDKRRRDLDNCAKALSDLLVSCGVVDDDSEAQYIELKWVSVGPPVWMAVRPCTRWATDLQSIRGD